MTAAEMWDQYGGIGKYSAWQFGNVFAEDMAVVCEEFAVVFKQ